MSRVSTISTTWHEIKRIYELNERDIVYAYKGIQNFEKIDELYESCELECRYIMLIHFNQTDDFIARLFRNVTELRDNSIMIVSLCLFRLSQETVSLVNSRYEEKILQEINNDNNNDTYHYYENNTDIAENIDDSGIEIEYSSRFDRSLLPYYMTKSSYENDEAKEDEEEENVAQDLYENYEELVHGDKHSGGKSTEDILVLFFHKLIYFLRQFIIINNIHCRFHKSFKIINRSFVYKYLRM